MNEFIAKTANDGKSKHIFWKLCQRFVDTFIHFQSEETGVI